MKNKKFLTEEDRLNDLAIRSKNIIESFSKEFNKIRRKGLIKEWDYSDRDTSEIAEEIAKSFEGEGANVYRLISGKQSGVLQTANVTISANSGYDMIDIRFQNVKDARAMATEYQGKIAKQYPFLKPKEGVEKNGAIIFRNIQKE